MDPKSAEDCTIIFQLKVLKLYPSKRSNSKTGGTGNDNIGTVEFKAFF